jgi:hypothetical protein
MENKRGKTSANKDLCVPNTELPSLEIGGKAACLIGDAFLPNAWPCVAAKVR